MNNNGLHCDYWIGNVDWLGNGAVPFLDNGLGHFTERTERNVVTREQIERLTEESDRLAREIYMWECAGAELCSVTAISVANMLEEMRYPHAARAVRRGWKMARQMREIGGKING